MKKVTLAIIIVFSFCILTFSQLNEIKILPSIGSEDAHFGQAVSIDGEYAIVGAPGSDTVFIFNKSGINWVEQEILAGDVNPPGSTLPPAFGFSVCISGNYLIVGAPFQVIPPILNNIGAAYIYKYDGANWVLHQKIPPPEGHLFGLFGWSVAISNSFAVIGEADRSSTHIYERIGEIWSLDTTITNSGWRLGESVAISEYFIAAGTPGGSFWYTDGQGSAYIFSDDGVDWIQEAHLQASDGTDIDGFGESLSITNTTLIAGDSKAFNTFSMRTGAAYIFNLENVTWIEKQKLTVGDGSSGDLLGFDVCISGDYIVASAPEDQDNGIKSGSVYIFWNDGDNWVETQKLLASDGDANDNFGYSVSISGGYIIVGADGNDDYGNNSGAAYIYWDFATNVDNEHFQNPIAFHLSENYPNPFNPSTTIKFRIPELSFVTLKIYDVLGKEIATLVNEEQTAGEYEVEFNAAKLPSSIYFFRLQAGSFVKTKKMVLMK